ncbi:uncharacterized protein TNCV_734231 [Trichonephila clavipes]|nr:uncharacterized protein TNCV_734231 [Trichonephila clavipes]
MMTETWLGNEERLSIPNFDCCVQFKRPGHRAAVVAIYRKLNNSHVVTPHMNIIYRQANGLGGPPPKCLSGPPVDRDQLNVTPVIKARMRKGRIEAFTTGSPHTNTIVITAEIGSGFVTRYDLAPFRCNLVSTCAAPLQTEASMGGVKNSSTSGRRDPKCPSVRRLHMVRKDTGIPNEGATCAWMAADEAVGCTWAFLTMW